VVTFHGRDVYLGKHDTLASRQAYEQFIVQWRASLERREEQRPDGPRTQRSDATLYSVSIVEMIVAYVKFASTYYRKDGNPTSEVAMIKAVLQIVREEFGRLSAAEFSYNNTGTETLSDYWPSSATSSRTN
jgi:hypothetical protein